MEVELKTLLEQQLEAQNQRIAELRLEQQQMFEKMMTLLQKEKSNEVNSNNSNNSNSELLNMGSEFKFLPKIEFFSMG